MNTVAPVQTPHFAIDPRIDCVITLRFENPIKGRRNHRRGGQIGLALVRIRYMRACEADNHERRLGTHWHGCLITRNCNSPFSWLVARVPSECLELSDFCSRSQALAEVLGAQIDMPSVSTMIESAKELDAIAAESDIQLSINVTFDGKAKTRADLDALMQERNFVLSKNNQSYEFFSNNHILFASNTLDLDQPITGISLLLELPLVAQEQMGFERMLAEECGLS